MTNDFIHFVEGAIISETKDNIHCWLDLEKVNVNLINNFTLYVSAWFFSFTVNGVTHCFRFIFNIERKFSNIRKARDSMCSDYWSIMTQLCTEKSVDFSGFFSFDFEATQKKKRGIHFSILLYYWKLRLAIFFTRVRSS